MTWEPSREHFSFITSVDFKHNDETNTDYYLKIKGNTLICLFEPTTDKRDWRSNLNFFPERIDLYSGSNVFGHNGIAKQYLGIRDEFLDMAYKEEINNIYIAGFSLGGGLSQFACEDAAYHLPDKEIISIAYEGPRVFCPNKNVKKLINNRQILVKSFWDPVVHVPLRIMGFTEYGRKIWIGKWNKIISIQHRPDEIRNNLFDKFGK
jgi:hypothetical protein